MVNTRKTIPYKKTLLAVAISLLAPLASAQMLEEVVVTAQKRAESAQDVPISVNAISGDFIANSGMKTVQAVAEMVPNFQIGDSPGNNVIMMRGVGSGPGDRTFEQSVGLYIDGIFSGRAPLFQVPFLDVDRVEVLRGAQGVLFGKNSIAGAVSIHTKKPSDEFEAAISGSYEFEYDQQDVVALVSGALADNVFARLVVNTNEGGEWLDNALSGEYTPQRRTDAYRLSVVWESTDTTEIFFKGEYSEFEVDGPGFQIEAEQGSVAGDFIAMPLDDLIAFVQAPPVPTLGPPAGQVLSMRLAGEDFRWNDHLTANRDDVGIDQDTESYLFQVKQLLGEHELTYLFGYAEYDRIERMDNDFSATDFAELTSPEKYDQLTHELRISSPGDEAIDYVVGIYYLDRNFDMPNLDTYFNAGPLAVSWTGKYQENTESWSAFAQATWNISDTFRATLGARYSDEEKTASKSQFLRELDGEEPLIETNPVIYTIVTTVFPFNDYHFVGKREEQSLDPALNIQWDFSDASMAYASLTKATKGGGFSGTINGGEPPSPPGWEFDEEEAKSVEVGVKTEYWDGRTRSNLAVFYTKFDDLQVSSFVAADNTFVTSNAAKATSAGFELENVFAVSDEWTLGANLAYLRAEYDEWDAACPGSNAQWEGRGNCAETGGTGFVDMEGESLMNAPQWNGQLYADYSTSLTDRLNLSARLDTTYSDEYRVGVHDVPKLVQDSFWKANLRVALNASDDSWTVGLAAINLTDEQILTGGGDSFGLPGAYWKNRTIGRQLQLQASYRFF